MRAPSPCPPPPRTSGRASTCSVSRSTSATRSRSTARAERGHVGGRGRRGAPDRRLGPGLDHDRGGRASARRGGRRRFALHGPHPRSRSSGASGPPRPRRWPAWSARVAAARPRLGARPVVGVRRGRRDRGASGQRRACRLRRVHDRDARRLGRTPRSASGAPAAWRSCRRRGCATSEARAALPASVSREDAVFNVAHAALAVRAFTADPALLARALADRLHEEVRLGLSDLTDVVALLRARGGPGVRRRRRADPARFRTGRRRARDPRAARGVQRVAAPAARRARERVRRDGGRWVSSPDARCARHRRDDRARPRDRRGVPGAGRTGRDHRTRRGARRRGGPRPRGRGPVRSSAPTRPRPTRSPRASMRRSRSSAGSTSWSTTPASGRSPVSWSTPVATYDAIMDVNVRGAFLYAQACFPHLEATGGLHAPRGVRRRRHRRGRDRDLLGVEGSADHAVEHARRRRWPPRRSVERDLPG